jgi:hypothetical protein
MSSILIVELIIVWTRQHAAMAEVIPLLLDKIDVAMPGDISVCLRVDRIRWQGTFIGHLVSTAIGPTAEVGIRDCLHQLVF